MSSHEEVMAATPLPPRISCEEFRRELAGLTAEKEAEDHEGCRDHAVRLARLMIRHMNTEVLGTNWKGRKVVNMKRIESGLQLAAEKAGGRVDELLSTAMQHVMAEQTWLNSDDEFLGLLGELDSAGRPHVEALCSYIKRCRSAVIAFAHLAQKQQKSDYWKDRTGRHTAEDEAAAREAGEAPCYAFDEDEVQAALQRRAAERGEGDK
jgi:hypothetical protein